MFVAIVGCAVGAAACLAAPRTSDQRLGTRVIDGTAEILVGLCDGEQIDRVQVQGPADQTAGEEEFVDWWVIERRDEEAAPATEGQRDAVITLGQVPEGFEETVDLRGAIPEPPAQLFGWVYMGNGARATFRFDESAFESDGRWYIVESNALFTTEELLAQRTQVCPETSAAIG